MDSDELTGSYAATGLPGLTPLIDRAIQEALRRHLADAAAAAIDSRLGHDHLDHVAGRAVERQLLDLAEPPTPYFPTLPEWVDQWLLPVYRRSIKGPERAWCPQWWRHDEAVARLDAMWRAWEHLRLDAATGLSVWFRDHADHHMTVLLDANGPFKGCDATHSDRPLEPLPHEPPPPGTFQPDDEFIPSAPVNAPVGVLGHSPAVGRSAKIGQVR
jgi:Domain of unknown function (DUF4913)